MVKEKKKIKFEDLVSKWWFWVAVAVVVVFIGALFYEEEPSEKKKPEQPQTAQVDNKKKEEDKQKAEQEKMDRLKWSLSGDCQEAVINSRKLPNYVKVNTITSNVTISKMGFYDESKNPIYIVRWDGKNTRTGERIMFDCFVSENSGKAKIHWVNSGDITFSGWKDYSKYDENGKKI